MSLSISSTGRGGNKLSGPAKRGHDQGAGGPGPAGDQGGPGSSLGPRGTNSEAESTQLMLIKL